MITQCSIIFSAPQQTKQPIPSASIQAQANKWQVTFVTQKCQAMAVIHKSLITSP